MKSLWIVVLLMSAVCGAQDVVAKPHLDTSDTAVNFTVAPGAGEMVIFYHDNEKVLRIETGTDSITIFRDGRVTGKNLTEAATTFWKLVAKYAPISADCPLAVERPDAPKIMGDWQPHYTAEIPLKLQQRIKELEAENNALREHDGKALTVAAQCIEQLDASTQTGEAIRLAPGWTMHHIFVDGDKKEIGPICDGKNAPLTPKDKAKIGKAIQEIDQSATRKR